MREIDILDEAFIAADPSLAFRALIDEMMGITNWWFPHLEARLRGDTPADQTSAVLDITVHAWGTPRFTAKTIQAEENKMRIFSPLVDIGQMHSQVMKHSFEGLKRFVMQKETEKIVH